MTKTQKNPQVLKETLSEMRLFTSLDIHFNNSVKLKWGNKIKPKEIKLKKLDNFWDLLRNVFSIDISKFSAKKIFEKF